MIPRRSWKAPPGAWTTPPPVHRLGRLFAQSPQFWLNMQLRYDVWHAERTGIALDIAGIQPLVAVGAVLDGEGGAASGSGVDTWKRPRLTSVMVGASAHRRSLR